MAGGRVLPMSAAIPELMAKSAENEGAGSSALNALRSAENQLETFNSFQTSIQEKVAQLQSNNTRFDDQ